MTVSFDKKREEFDKKGEENPTLALIIKIVLLLAAAGILFYFIWKIGMQ